MIRGYEAYRAELQTETLMYMATSCLAERTVFRDGIYIFDTRSVAEEDPSDRSFNTENRIQLKERHLNKSISHIRVDQV